MKNCLMIALILTFFGCDNLKDGDVDIHKFTMVESMKLSEFISEIKTIPLTSTDSSVIEDMAVIKFYKNDIIVLDIFSPTKSAYIFGTDGSFKQRVGNIGRGPGEYLMPYNLFFHRDTIFIHDNQTNTILKYDAVTFDYQDKYDMAFFTSCSEQLPDGNIAWYVSSGQDNKDVFANHIQITDINGNHIASHMPSQEFQKYGGMYNTVSYFHRNGEQVLFHHPYQATLFSVSNEECRPEYKLEFDKHLFAPLSFYQQSADGSDFMAKLRESQYIQYYDLRENNKMQIIRFFAGKDLYVGYYDKNTQAGQYCKMANIKDDIGIGYIPRIKSVYDNYFICSIPVETYVEAGGVVDNRLGNLQDYMILMFR